MPLHDFECVHCGLVMEGVLIRGEADLNELDCAKCGSTELQKLMSAHGGYAIRGNNSASQRPRNAGSFR